jgi:hypothetical protein
VQRWRQGIDWAIEAMAIISKFDSTYTTSFFDCVQFEMICSKHREKY